MEIAVVLANCKRDCLKIRSTHAYQPLLPDAVPFKRRMSGQFTNAVSLSSWSMHDVNLIILFYKSLHAYMTSCIQLGKLTVRHQ